MKLFQGAANRVPQFPSQEHETTRTTPVVLGRRALDAVENSTPTRARRSGRRSPWLLRAGAVAALAGAGLAGGLSACGGHAAGEGKFEPAVSTSPRVPTVAGTSTPESSKQGDLHGGNEYAYKGQPVCDVVDPGIFAETFKADASDISGCSPDSPWQPPADYGVISSGTWTQQATGNKYEVVVTHDAVKGRSIFDGTANVTPDTQKYNVAMNNSPELDALWSDSANINGVQVHTPNEGLVDVWFVYDNSASNGGQVRPLGQPNELFGIGAHLSQELVPEFFSLERLHQ